MKGIVFAGLICIACSRPEQQAAPAADSTPSVIAVPPVFDNTPRCTITQTSIGNARLGATLQQIKDEWSGATLTRTSDGEGVALVQIAVGADSLVTAYAGEDDPEKPVDLTRRVTWLETFSDKCSTADGIRPGLTIRSAESKLGVIQSVDTSEIEQRKFIRFANQPSWMTLRVEDGLVWSIAIASQNP